jgi:hypothetical protein
MTLISLREALKTMPPIPELEREVLNSLGYELWEEAAGVDLLGWHITVGVDTAGVYLVTAGSFALFEANSAGRSFTLTVGMSRVRRVARLEDADLTRLIIEIEADRSTSVSRMDSEGQTEGQHIPAGYELVESSVEGRRSLRELQKALSLALGL